MKCGSREADSRLFMLKPGVLLPARLNAARNTLNRQLLRLNRRPYMLNPTPQPLNAAAHTLNQNSNKLNVILTVPLAYTVLTAITRKDVHMVQYYWNPVPGYGQQLPQMTPPPAQPAGGRPPFREESYIENILRLNKGKPGVFHFSFEHAVEAGKNTKAVAGMVEAAGRDHVILSEANTGRRYLFPMIYFDYAEFNEELNYFDQTPY